MSNPRREKSVVLLIKLEAIYGVDAMPTAAVNAVEATDVSFTVIEREQVENDYYLPYNGHQGVRWGAKWQKITFSVDLVGSGTAGTPPAFGALLKACSMAEVIVAAAKVTYQRATDMASPSVVAYFIRDGKKYVGVGGRGTWKISAAASRRAKIVFEFTLLVGGLPSDIAPPVPVLTAWRRSVVFSSATVPVFTLGGTSVKAETFEIDFGNKVSKGPKINWNEVEIEDGQSTGTLVVESGSVADAPWDAAAADDSARLPVVVQIGAEAGSIVTFRASAAQVGELSETFVRGRVHDSLPLMFTAPSDGGDLELEFT